MKKILMGLVAISAFSFAAINLNDPQPNSNVFKPGQEGLVTVNGKVQSLIPVVKYVVFANSTDSFTGSKAELVLPELVLSQVAGENTFKSTPEMLYVRKVNDLGTDTEALNGEVVKFTINLDDAYTGITGRTIGNSQKLIIAPTALMQKSDLETLIQNSGTITTATVGVDGIITKDSKFYRTPNNVQFISKTNGELTVELVTNSDFSSNAMGASDAQAVQNLFGTVQQVNNMSISVDIQ